ncbi:hypothetical protein K7432_001655 [Basidiobolus ranarum]|uniref:Uncharacterized protein n=1 Tax=Basidiobolus ranarum TaxID=34480 RepID=A0ABR2W966_9FUNG
MEPAQVPVEMVEVKVQDLVLVVTEDPTLMTPEMVLVVTAMAQVLVEMVVVKVQDMVLALALLLAVMVAVRSVNLVTPEGLMQELVAVTPALAMVAQEEKDQVLEPAEVKDLVLETAEVKDLVLVEMVEVLGHMIQAMSTLNVSCNSWIPLCSKLPKPNSFNFFIPNTYGIFPC